MLPNTSRFVPAALYKEALGLIGLAHSLANAPPSVAGDAPQATTAEMNDRVYRLSQMGRQVSPGRGGFRGGRGARRGVAGRPRRRLGMGRPAPQDHPRPRIRPRAGRAAGGGARRRGRRGGRRRDPRDHRAGGAPTTTTSRRSRWAPTAPASSSRSPAAPAASGCAAAPLRCATCPSPSSIRSPKTPPWAWSPGTEAGGYEARLRRTSGSGSISFELILPAGEPTAELTRYRWDNVSLPAGSAAKVIFDAAGAGTSLAIDDDGDGLTDRDAMPAISPLERRPFEVVSARQEFGRRSFGPRDRAAFSTDIDLASMVPRDPDHFRIDGPGLERRHDPGRGQPLGRHPGRAGHRKPARGPVQPADRAGGLQQPDQARRRNRNDGGRPARFGRPRARRAGGGWSSREKAPSWAPR